MASYPSVVVAVLLLLLFIQSASGWRSYCKLKPDPIVPAPVDCSKLLLTWIDKCFCDRDVTMFQECAHRVRDELDPERATPAIVYEISVIVERFSAVGPLDTETQQTLWQLYDKLLLVRQPVFVRSNDDQWSSTQRLLTSLDRMMRGADPEAATYMKGTNLALLKQPREKCEQNAKVGQGIADYGSHFGPLGEEGGGINPLASIEVPADVACKSGEAEEESDEDAAAIFFVLYRKAHLFLGNSTHPSNARFGRELDGGDRSRRCKPGLFADKDRTVLSATVVDGGQQRNISSSNNGTKTMAKLSYRKQPFPALHGEYLATWWEVDQSWWAEDDACRLVHKGDLLEAECPHLTDFTLLVNGLETDPSLCDGFLNVLGYTLNLGSFLALLVLNALYLVYKRPALYDRVFVQLLANRLPRMKLDSEAVFYNVSLMLFYFSFAVFSDEKHTGSGGVFCRMVAIFNYWLLMACILQTIFQAWRILKMFLWTVALERAVIVATKRRYVLGISFGLPTLLCLLFGLLADNFFYRNDEFCWIRPSYVWFAVVLPLSLLLLNAVVCSAVICFRLFPNSCGMERVWQKHASSTIRLAKGVRKQSQQKLTVLLLMQFSLGMPWILQFATLAIPHVSVFHFLFTLVNGSQGMMLLSLFGFKQVQAWRSVRASQKRPTTEEEPNKVPDSPKVENGDVFTNSIGMRIPVAQPTKTEGKQQKKEKEQKSKGVAGEKH